MGQHTGGRRGSSGRPRRAFLQLRVCVPDLQHPLGQDAVALGGVPDQDMGDGPHEPAVLKDGAAAHMCVKIRTTFFEDILGFS